jgi:hypothetical protein
VPREAERARVERWALRHEFPRPRELSSLQGNDHRHPLSGVGVLEREAREQLGEFMQKAEPQRLDLNRLRAVSLEEEDRVSVQALVWTAADPHFGYVRVGQAQLAPTLAGTTLEEQPIFIDNERPSGWDSRRYPKDHRVAR